MTWYTLNANKNRTDFELMNKTPNLLPADFPGSAVVPEAVVTGVSVFASELDLDGSVGLGPDAPALVGGGTGATVCPPLANFAAWLVVVASLPTSFAVGPWLSRPRSCFGCFGCCDCCGCSPAEGVGRRTGKTGEVSGPSPPSKLVDESVVQATTANGFHWPIG